MANFLMNQVETMIETQMYRVDTVTEVGNPVAIAGSDHMMMVCQTRTETQFYAVETRTERHIYTVETSATGETVATVENPVETAGNDHWATTEASIENNENNLIAEVEDNVLNGNGSDTIENVWTGIELLRRECLQEVDPVEHLEAMLYVEDIGADPTDENDEMNEPLSLLKVKKELCAAELEGAAMPEDGSAARRSACGLCGGSKIVRKRGVTTCRSRQCPLCSRRLSSGYSLSRHVGRLHPEVVSCPHCKSLSGRNVSSSIDFECGGHCAPVLSASSGGDSPGI